MTENQVTHSKFFINLVFGRGKRASLFFFALMRTYWELYELISTYKPCDKIALIIFATL